MQIELITYDNDLITNSILNIPTGAINYMKTSIYIKYTSNAAAVTASSVLQTEMPIEHIAFAVVYPN